MAVSVAAAGFQNAHVIGDLQARIVDVTIGTYATNGVAFDYNTAGLGLTARVEFVAFTQTAGYVLEYDYTAHKIKVFRQKDPADAGGADIALPEVANGVNLGSVVTRALVIGK